jgi:DNA repair protein RecN (Recombination protein N)
VLERLTIRNFAIIDHLELCWRPGLTVITGETGAGKSILVDAVGALLGDRLGPEMVRSGADRALVEGVFVLPLEPPPALSAVLEEHGIEPEDGALIVTRDIAGVGGRGGARINARSVPLATLQQLGEQLVDVHGQSEHMALLRPREQLEYLDRYAGLQPERVAVAALVRRLRDAREARRRLQQDEREAARQAEMLKHEAAEIEQAELRPGEEEELLTLRNRLEHAERLRQAATQAYEALTGVEGSEGDRPGAVDLLGQAVQACADGARFDPALGAEPLEDLNGALAQAEDAARGLRDYVDSIESDPTVLESVQARLFLLADLRRKYGEDVEAIIRYGAEARARLDEYQHRDERLAELTRAEQELRAELGRAAAALSDRRRTTARNLERAVEQELADLRMSGTTFRVAMRQEDDPDGVPVAGRVVGYADTGVDQVEFLVAANKGEEPRPMARVASGGELARIALALKTILSRADSRATLIFDEVDQGVGGRTAPVVGQKLWSVASAGHQVLCVTHMPQVAAFADNHCVVAKVTADNKRSQTEVETLDDEAQRVEELATMLAGSPSSAARASARELLDRAQRFKADALAAR